MKSKIMRDLETIKKLKIMRIGTIDYIDILRSELKSLESQMSKGGMSEEEEDDLQSQIEQKLEEIEDMRKNRLNSSLN